LRKYFVSDEESSFHDVLTPIHAKMESYLGPQVYILKNDDLFK